MHRQRCLEMGLDIWQKNPQSHLLVNRFNTSLKRQTSHWKQYHGRGQQYAIYPGSENKGRINLSVLVVFYWNENLRECEHFHTRFSRHSRLKCHKSSFWEHFRGLRIEDRGQPFHHLWLIDVWLILDQISLHHLRCITCNASPTGHHRSWIRYQCITLCASPKVHHLQLTVCCAQPAVHHLQCMSCSASPVNHHLGCITCCASLVGYHMRCITCVASHAVHHCVASPAMHNLLCIAFCTKLPVHHQQCITYDASPAVHHAS